MKSTLAALALTAVAGCAHFGAPDEDIQNGLIAGKPFAVTSAGKSVTVIPVAPRHTMPCPSTACANVAAGTIFIRQRPSMAAMMSDYRHEIEHVNGMRHENDTTGPVRDERAEAMERARADACSRSILPCVQ